MSVLLLESDAIRIEISPPDQPSALKSIDLSPRGRFSADSKQVPSIDARTVHKASLSLQIIFHHPSYVRSRFRGIKDRGLVPTDLTWRLVAVLGLVNRHSRLLAIRQLGKCCSLLGV
jgi:hypothetical protein